MGIRRRGQLLLSEDLAGRWRAARPHHRCVAADGGAVSSLMTQLTPLFELVLVTIVICVLLILAVMLYPA